MLKVLSIESSCDETACAVIQEDKTILSHVIISQLDEHKDYGGVVPEIAARSHLEYMPRIIEKSIKDANLSITDLDLIAATGGPGLIGGVITGVMFAKSIAYSLNKPFLAINHLEGHALTTRLTSDIDYPFLLLLISGGHCQFVIVEDIAKYKIIGSTIDDAIGEVFDKVSKMLNLGYPGGPIIEKLAKLGDQNRFNFPKPLIDQKNCNMSFSGLKTAINREIAKSAITEQDKTDVAASFQKTVSSILNKKIKFAIDIYNKQYHNKKFVLSGGVAANIYLRNEIKSMISEYDFELITPPIELCTDNAAMIGWAAIERFKTGYISDFDFAPRDRWNIETK